MDYPNRLEWQTRCEFNAYCKRALRNELIDACRERKRRQLREVIFSDLTPQEERQLYTVDKYFQDEEAEPRYQMAGKEILLFTTFYMPAWNLGTIWAPFTEKAP